MDDNKIKYNIALSDGRTEDWTQEQWDQKGSTLMEQYPDAKVVRTSAYDGSEEGDEYQIDLSDGRSETWTADQWKQKGSKLREFFPDAKVSVRKNMSAAPAQKPVDNTPLTWQEQMQYSNLNAARSGYVGAVTEASEKDAEMRHNAADQYEYRAIRGQLQSVDDALDQKREKGESRKEYKEEKRGLKKLEFELNQNLKDNPVYQQEITEGMDDLEKEQYKIGNELAELNKKSNEYIAENKIPGTYGQPIVFYGSKEDTAKYNNYKAAQALNAESQNLYGAEKKGEVKALGDVFAALWNGLGDTVTAEKFWNAMAANEHGRALRDLHEKVLAKVDSYNGKTEEEIEQALGEDLDASDLALLRAYFNNADAQANNTDIHWAYKAGETTAISLKMMAEFMVTGATGIQKELAGALMKVAGKAAGKVGLKLAENAVGKVTKWVGQQISNDVAAAVMGTAQTALSPTTWANLSEALAQIDPATGQLVNVSDTVKESLFQSFVENFTELGGGVSSKVLGLAGKALSKVERLSWLTKMAEPVKQAYQKAGIGSFLEEYGEEVDGTIIDWLVGGNKDAFNDFFELDQQLSLLTSFGLTIGAGQVYSNVNRMRIDRQYDKAMESFNNVLGSLDYKDKEAYALKTEITNYVKDLKDGKDAKSAILDKFITQNSSNESAVRSLTNLISTEAKRQAYNDVEAFNRDNLRAEKREELRQTYGDFWKTDKQGNETVDIVSFADGNRYMVQGESGDSVAVLDAAGNKRTLSKSALEQMTALETDSENGAKAAVRREMSLNDFLDSEMLEAHNRADAQRLATQRQNWVNEMRAKAKSPFTYGQDQVQGQVVNGVVTNAGATVQFEKPVTIDGTTASIFQLSLDQLSDVMGVALDEMSDDDRTARQVANMENADAAREAVNSSARGKVLNINGINRKIIKAVRNEEVDKGDTTYVTLITENEDRQTESIMVPFSQIQQQVDEVAGVQLQDTSTIEQTAQDLDSTPRDFRGNPLPLNMNGSVNQNALFENDAEAWAKWNDQYGRGQAETVAYLGNVAVPRLAGKIAEIDTELAQTADFDKRDALLEQRDALVKRTDLLNGILSGYNEAANTRENAKFVEHVKRLQEMMDEVAEVPTIVVTSENVLEVLAADQWSSDAARDANIESVRTQLENATAMQAMGFSLAGVNGFRANGKIYIMAEYNTEKSVMVTYNHERQHEINAREKADPESLMNKLANEVSRDDLLAAVRALSRSRAYDRLDAVGLADELIAFSMEDAEEKGVKTSKLRHAGLSEETITLINDAYGKRRNGSLRNDGQRGTVSDDNTSFRVGDDGAAPQGAAGALEDQRQGLDGRGAPEAEEPAEEEVNAFNPVKDVEDIFDGKAGATFDLNGELVADKPEGSPVRFSVRTWEKTGRPALVAYLNKHIKSGDIEQSVADSILSEMDRMTVMAKEIAAGDPSGLFGQWSFDLVRRKDGTQVPVLHALKNNAEYSLNIDFSTVCKKRQVLDFLMNRLIREGHIEKENLSPADVARINQIIQKHALEIACSICFVDSRRYNAYTFANGFLDKYNPLVQSLAPKQEVAGYNYANDEKFSNEGKVDLSAVTEVVDWQTMFDKSGKKAVGKKDYTLDWSGIANIFSRDRIDSKGKPKLSVIKAARREFEKNPTIGSGKDKRPKTFTECVYSACDSAEEKMAFYISQNPQLRKLAKAEDFVASEGWTNILQSNEDLEKLWNIQKGAAGARANEGNVQYQEDVLNKDANKVTIWDIGGYRMQSFSDFIGHMYFDYLQAFADLAAKTLPGHAYTKEPSFVKLFGLMGMKVNMSLVSEVDTRVVEELGKDYAGLTYGPDGNLTYAFNVTRRDRKGNIVKQGQTFPPEEAFALQADSRYGINAGTILVGLSDEHINMALDDPKIRMVIPYHKSGLPHGVAIIYNINEINDYTDFQNTSGKHSSLTAAQKKVMHKQVDQYNFILHQLSIAENRDAAYNALRQIFVDEDASKFDKHKRFAELYQQYASGELTGELPYQLSEQREDDGFLPKVAADIYLAACEAKDYTPKFVNFADHHDYYKVLIDFAVYDENGHYTPQQAVHFEVPENVSEYIAETLREDEEINAKKEAEAEPIIREIVDYLADKDFRRRQDIDEESALKQDIFNVGDPRNIAEVEEQPALTKEQEQAIAFVNGQPTVSFRTTEQRDAIFQNAKDTYGITKDLREAGYVLPDGAMLDFSEKNNGGPAGQRSLDHRDIAKVLTDVHYDTQTEYLDDFLNMGAIRLMPESGAFSISVKPTKEQKDVLRSFIYRKNGEVEVEIYKDGHSVADPYYRARTSPSRVLNDIDQYFDEGIIPEGNEPMFRSIEITPETRKEMDSIKEAAMAAGTFMKAPNGADTNLTEEQWLMVRTKAFKDWFGDWENDSENASKVVDENGEPKVMYHGTRFLDEQTGEPFNTFDANSGGDHYYDYSVQHFGTKEQADDITSFERKHGRYNKIYPVFLNIRNPYRIEDQEDSEGWLYAAKTAAKGEFVGQDNVPADGIVYLNLFEGRERADSYMIWDANQVKSAVENNGEFSRENDDIRFRISDKQLSEISNYDSENNTDVKGFLDYVINGWDGTSHQWKLAKLKHHGFSSLMDAAKHGIVPIIGDLYVDSSVVSPNRHSLMIKDADGSLIQDPNHSVTQEEWAAICAYLVSDKPKTIAITEANNLDAFELYPPFRHHNGLPMAIVVEQMVNSKKNKKAYLITAFGEQDEVTKGRKFLYGSYEKVKGIPTSRVAQALLDTTISWQIPSANKDTNSSEDSNTPKENVVSLEKMTDEKASALGYTIKAFHGTNQQIKGSLTPGLTSSDAPGIWFTEEKEAAEAYASGRKKLYGGEENVVPVYLKMENPLEIDAEGKPFSQIPTRFEVFDGNDYDEVFNTRAEAVNAAKERNISEDGISIYGESEVNDIVSKAQKDGYDGVIIRNVIDAGDESMASTPQTDYVVFDENQVLTEEQAENLNDDGGVSFRFVGIQALVRTAKDTEEKGAILANFNAAHKALKTAVTDEDFRRIKLATGWEKGTDGRMRYEESDFSVKPMGEWSEKNRLDDIVSDETLFKEYPGFKDVSVVLDNDMKQTASAQASQNLIKINPAKVEAKGYEPRKVLLHEVQHLIQRAEGWAVGSNVGRELRELGYDTDTLEEAKRNYRRAAGEVEARNVEARSEMTDEQRRASLASDTEDIVREEQVVRYREVDDPTLLEQLNNSETIKVYRAMQLVNGNLYPPMSGKVPVTKTSKKGTTYTRYEWRDPIRLGVWEQSEEHPDLADEDGNFTLNKGNGDSIKAAYNPYIHTSRTPLNDQFSSAQTRPELVTVEVEVPVSELTSGYRAEKAKDAVGVLEWKAGPIQGKLSGTREVILTRYDKPVRIVPDSEVADEIMKMLEGQKIDFPTNVVTPALRAELEKRGVAFYQTDNQGTPVETVRFRSIEDRLESTVGNTDIINEIENGGLESVLGKDGAEKMYMAAYMAMPEDIRDRIIDVAEKNGFNFTEATKQVLASLAERDDLSYTEQEALDSAREALEDMLGKSVTMDDAKWILYMAEHSADTDILEKAVNALVGARLLQDEKSRNQKADAFDDVRFREVNAEWNMQATDFYSEELNVGAAISESNTQMYTSVEKMVKAIVKATGKKVQDFEDVLLTLNQLSSINFAQKDRYLKNYLEPMWNAIRSIMVVDSGHGRTKADRKATMEKLVEYIQLKHGLERNEVFARRDAKAFYDAAYQNECNAIDADTSLSKAEKDQRKDDAKRVRDAHYADVDNGMDGKYLEFRKKDYSGLMSWFVDEPQLTRRPHESNESFRKRVRDARKPLFKTLSEAEDEAQKYVDKFEADMTVYTDELPAYNNHKGIIPLTQETRLTDILWDRINACTKETLRHQRETGMITQEQYEHVRDMFAFYVPLRGFKEETAEDVYMYYSEHDTDFQKPILGAKGRRSLADNPFGMIATMAESAIQQGNKNKAKQALYFFIANRPNNGLAELRECWFEETGRRDANGRKEYRRVYPDMTDGMTQDEIDDAWEQLDADMAAKRAANPGLDIVKGKSRLNVRDTFVKMDDSSAKEHIIQVMVNGREQEIFVNANPRAAQAINGKLNGEVTDSQLKKGAMFWNRLQSALATSLNPNFVPTNFVRDMLYSQVSALADHGPKFWANYNRSLFRIIPVIPQLRMIRLMNNFNGDPLALGIEQQCPELAKAYEEFVMNGGPTGYTNLTNNKEYDEKLLKAMNHELGTRAAKSLWGLKMRFDDVMESVEQVARFAAYLTAKDLGMSEVQSINAAKEITLNFNTKGSGKRITWEESKQFVHTDNEKVAAVQRFFICVATLPAASKPLVMFYNAAVQGIAKFISLTKKSAVVMVPAMAMNVAAGAMNALIHALCGGDDDDKEKEPVDDYFNIPDFIRRTSYCLGSGKDGRYVRLPIPQEFAAFYALGDILVTEVFNKTKVKPNGKPMREILTAFGELLPYNVMEIFNNEDGVLSGTAEMLGRDIAILSVPYSLMTNRTFYGAAIHPENKFQSKEVKDDAPHWYESNPDDADPLMPFYINIAKWLSNHTGGDEGMGGKINAYPEDIKFVMQDIAGGAGKFWVQAASELVGKISGKPNPAEDKPILNRFLVDTDSKYNDYYYKESYYWYRSNVLQVQCEREKRYRDIWLLDNPDKAEELFEEYKKEHPKSKATELTDAAKRAIDPALYMPEKVYNSPEFQLWLNMRDDVDRQYFKPLNIRQFEAEHGTKYGDDEVLNEIKRSMIRDWIDTCNKLYWGYWDRQSTGDLGGLTFGDEPNPEVRR